MRVDVRLRMRMRMRISCCVFLFLVANAKEFVAPVQLYVIAG